MRLKERMRYQVGLLYEYGILISYSKKILDYFYDFFILYIISGANKSVFQ